MLIVDYFLMILCLFLYILLMTWWKIKVLLWTTKHFLERGLKH